MFFQPGYSAPSLTGEFERFASFHPCNKQVVHVFPTTVDSELFSSEILTIATFHQSIK